MENIFYQSKLSNNKWNKGDNSLRWSRRKRNKNEYQSKGSTLASAQINEGYIIKMVETDNAELQDFLFTLGCYQGEKVTVVSILADQYIVVVKDARYSIDKELAACIKV